MIKKLLLHIICILTSATLLGQSNDQNQVPFAIFNRSYNNEDIGARIFIDGELIFVANSINETFDMRRQYVTDLDTGFHTIQVLALESDFQTVDTVRVFTPSSLHRLWIDYRHIPDPKTQFEYLLKSKFQKEMKFNNAEPKDSTRIYEQVRLQLIEDKRYLIKDPIEPSFKIRWVYPIEE